MSIFAGDALIKQAIVLAIEDLRKNLFLIDDIFSDFLENPYLKHNYGAKEISRAREFVVNNKINYYLKHRLDNMNYPCVTISLASSTEDKSLSTLADQSVEVDELDPSDIDKPINYIVKPLKFTSYDEVTGIITLPSDTENLQYVGEGMVVINPKSGAGFVVSKSGEGYIQIAAGSVVDFDEIAVIPQYVFYRARRERIISQEVYSIGLHVSGDPAALTFLYGIVKYALLRYREGLLEYNNFQLTTLTSSSDMVRNEHLEADNIYSRYITLAGQCEESWLKTPYRVIEAIDIKDESLKSGIKIISNAETNSSSEEAENDLWLTIDDIEE